MLWKEIVIWKTIAEFPLYEVNEYGVVRNAKTHYVTAQRMNRYGYLYVQLTDGENNNTRYVHRLVAEAFIPNPENLPVVNHIDECCVHNSADNLEWVSYKDNSNHGTRNERIVRERKLACGTRGWIPEDEHDNNLEWLELTEKQKEQLRDAPKARIKSVSAINENGDKQFTFETLTEAAKKMGVSGPAVSSAIKKGTKCKGFNWIAEYYQE